MQGRPDDVRGIQAMLLSTGFFPTPESFNAHMSEKLTNFFLSNLKYIMGGAGASPPAPALTSPAARIAPAAASPDAIAAASESARAAELERVKAELERVKAEAAIAAEVERRMHAAELERIRSEAATASATPHCRCTLS
jgi:hypothetical protein